ncbi:MAG: RNA polymerase sigma factor [Lachnospiraceae bacterium]|nr:RNA polymerase sigma factor [Lachnospiraceae bacterium]
MDFEEQYDKIYRYCYMKLQHRQLAEDAAQETFLRFLNSKGYQEKGQAIRYLYTIARNLCIDEFRKPVYESLSREQECTLAESWEESMEERTVKSLTLRKALQSLEEEGRELILLRYVNELPVGDIAELMNISRFSVLRKTKKYLKELERELGGRGLYE